MIEKILIQVIKMLSSKLGRKPSQDIEHYLKKILFVLKHDIKWNSLNELDYPLSADTYKKKFYLWARLGVFEKAHQVVCQLLEKQKYFNHEHLKVMYMDSSDIMNKSGSEGIGRSFKYKFKNASKVNAIVDQNGIPLGIQIVPANQSDTTLISSTLDKVAIKIISSRKYPKYVVMDKGYISQPIREKEKKRAYLIYPVRDNMNESNYYNWHQRKKLHQYMKTRHVNETFLVG